MTAATDRRRCGSARPGPVCQFEHGHIGPHMYKCAGPSCPGYGYAASEHAHPVSCAGPSPLRVPQDHHFAAQLAAAEGRRKPLSTKAPVPPRSELMGAVRSRIDYLRMERDAGPSRARPPLYLEMAADIEATLPTAELVKRVTLGGLLALVWATIWCRAKSRAHAGSPVPWDPEAVQEWVVELHGMWPDRDREDRRRGIVFTMPSTADPRIPSAAANTAIAAVIARAMLHEGQEAMWLDDCELDPHELGELGLGEVCQVVAETIGHLISWECES